MNERENAEHVPAGSQLERTSAPPSMESSRRAARATSPQDDQAATAGAEYTLVRLPVTLRGLEL